MTARMFDEDAIGEVRCADGDLPGRVTVHGDVKCEPRTAEGSTLQLVLGSWALEGGALEELVHQLSRKVVLERSAVVAEPMATAMASVALVEPTKVTLELAKWRITDHVWLTQEGGGEIYFEWFGPEIPEVVPSVVLDLPQVELLLRVAVSVREWQHRLDYERRSFAAHQRCALMTEG